MYLWCSHTWNLLLYVNSQSTLAIIIRLAKSAQSPFSLRQRRPIIGRISQSLRVLEYMFRNNRAHWIWGSIFFYFFSNQHLFDGIRSKVPVDGPHPFHWIHFRGANLFAVFSIVTHRDQDLDPGQEQSRIEHGAGIQMNTRSIYIGFSSLSIIFCSLWRDETTNISREKTFPPNFTAGARAVWFFQSYC